MSGAHAAAHAWDTDPAFLPPTSSPGHMYIGMELPEPIGYDVCVVGGGVMGSAAAWHLAKAGRSVSLIEAHPLKGHARGSSHGGSRITRRTDADPLLAAMATAAMAEWRAVETAAAAAALPSRGEALSAAPLYRRCGSLDMGDPLSAPGLAELIRTAREEAPPRGGAAFEILSGAQIRARWRGFAGVPLTWRGVFNRDGGVLAPDVAVPTLQALAVACGATLRGNARVVGVREAACAGRACEVLLADGTRIGASRVVLAAGPWTAELLRRAVSPPPRRAPELTIWEITWAWYRLRPGADAAAAAAALPVWRAFWSKKSEAKTKSGAARGGGSSVRMGLGCYGFPAHERADAVKIAPHGHPTIGRFASPSRRIGRPSKEYVKNVTSFAAEHFTSLLEAGADAGEELEPHTCLYSVTRDGHFIIDWLPPTRAAAKGEAPQRSAQRILVLAGFNGSGFKHAPLIGKMAQEMVCAAEEGRCAEATRPPCFPAIEAFAIERPSLYAAASL